MRGTMMDFPLTVRMIFDRGVRLYPDQEIVTGGATGTYRYTFREMGERVHRLASALQRQGIKPGDRVASFAWNSYRHLELYFAVPLIGAVLHCANFRLPADQLAYILDHAGDRWVFADRSLLGLLRQLSLPKVERLVALDDGSGAELGDAQDYETLIEGGAARADFAAVDENDAAMMCYTSGTTGHPKGVAYSHRALVLHTFGECMADTLAVSQRDTIMPIVPMFHVNAWGLPYAATMVGAKLVLPGVAPKPDALVQLMADEGVTMTAGVPTIFLGLQGLIAQRRGELKLKELVIGGSAVPPSLIRHYDSLGITIVQAWGMTEMTPLGTVSRLKPALEAGDYDAQVAVRAKQGLPTAGVEIRAVDADAKDVPWDGQTMGELIVRGPWVTGSYFDDERSAASYTDDGWFRTGDIVTIDAEGYVEICDRTKDVIKSGGEWISSVALENALMGHPKVQEACVVATLDDRWGERPLACVVARAEQKGQITPDELTAHLVAGQVAKWWLPDRYEFVDEIPKTSTGKFDKKVLRAKLVGGAAVTAPSE
jgi:fatty-acyl-CoA synthase